MKILILYFSGTGNTKFVAEKINRRLRNKGYSTRCESIEKYEPQEVKSYDLLVFGYPVYGYDMPDFVKSYARQLPPPSSRGVILYSTMAYSSGNSLRKSAQLFMNNDCLVVGSERFLMPGNDHLIITKKESKISKRVLATDYNQVPEINNSITKIVDRIDHLSDRQIVDEDVRLPERSLIYLLFTPIVKLIFGLIKKTVLNRFRAHESCIDCGLCEEICPADNILVRDGKVEFGNNCYLCLRCINQCPVEAIQITRFTEGKFRYKGPTGDYIPVPLENHPDSSETTKP